jgi:hypothetical protein
LGAITNGRFREDPLDVRLHGRWAQKEALADFLTRETFTNESEDLDLARGEVVG